MKRSEQSLYEESERWGLLRNGYISMKSDLNGEQKIQLAEDMQ